MTNISKKIKEVRPRWLGHVERNTDEIVTMRTRRMGASEHRKIGRGERCCTKDTKEKGVQMEEALARTAQSLKTRCTDPK